MFVKAIMFAVLAALVTVVALSTMAAANSMNAKMNCGVFTQQTTNCPLK